MIVGLVLGVFTVLGGLLAAAVTGVTAALISIVGGIAIIFAILSRTIVRIISLPLIPYLRNNRDPVSPLGILSVAFTHNIVWI